jgi:hypothetical protein
MSLRDDGRGELACPLGYMDVLVSTTQERVWSSYLDPAAKHLFVPICFALAQSISAQSATQDINRLLAIWGQD